MQGKIACSGYFEPKATTMPTELVGVIIGETYCNMIDSWAIVHGSACSKEWPTQIWFHVMSLVTCKRGIATVDNGIPKCSTFLCTSFQKIYLQTQIHCVFLLQGFGSCRSAGFATRWPVRVDRRRLRCRRIHFRHVRFLNLVALFLWANLTARDSNTSSHQLSSLVVV